MPSSSNPLAELITKLNEIQPLASNVATLKASTIEQEAEALAAILEKIKPLLGVTAHRIKTGYHTSGQQFSKGHDQYHDQKGLILIDSFEQECTDRDTRGDYLGWQLVLLADGSLKTLERSGDWSRWQGESSGWQIREEEEDLTPADAVRRYGLKRIMDGLADELKEASERLQGLQAGYEERLATIARVREVLQ
jgi:hypothetical protein